MVEDLLSNDEDEEMALPERRISLGAQDAFLAGAPDTPARTPAARTPHRIS